jgi:hypothetical protein
MCLWLCGWSAFASLSSVRKGGKSSQFIPGGFIFFRCVRGEVTCVDEGEE